MVWPHSSRCLVPRALRSDEQGYPSMGPECSTPDGFNGSCATSYCRWVVESDYSLKFLAPECVMVPKAVGFEFWDTLQHSNVAMEIQLQIQAADFPLPLPEGTPISQSTWDHLHLEIIWQELTSYLEPPGVLELPKSSICTSLVLLLL